MVLTPIILIYPHSVTTTDLSQINEGPNFHLEVQQVPVPQPGPGQLLIKLNVTGLCGSDVHYMLNDLGSPVGMKDFNVRSPGHEGAGVVVKVRLPLVFEQTVLN